MKTFVLSIGLILLWVADFVGAHEARPIHVQITETSAAVFAVEAKVPNTVKRRMVPAVIMPADCLAQQQPVWQVYPGAFVSLTSYDCGVGLSGRELGIRFPVVNPSLSTLFNVRLLNGERHSKLLKPEQRSWVVPRAETWHDVARDYTLLGIRHIWGGVDHLLFVACLLFLARTGRRILITITGFTLAHSLTLALSTLQLVRLPVPPVEAAIALSIVFLAYEIARNDQESLTFRYPASVSTTFGLLHGFGFAAVLRAIGLPQTELPAALLFFNLGVEIGQVLFVLALVACYVSVKRLFRLQRALHDDLGTPLTVLQVPASYLIGTLASFWLINRVTAF